MMQHGDQFVLRKVLLLVSLVLSSLLVRGVTVG
jgi:hypothetical protein